MANLLTRNQLAALIQKSPQYVGVLVNRGKLIENNKKINTDTKHNKICLSKFILKELEKVEIENSAYQPKLKGKSYTNLGIELKEKDLEIKIIKIQKDKLDLSKKQAKLIELLEAKDIMQRAIVVLSSQYRQNSKLYILGLAAKYKIPDDSLAGIQKWFDETINKSVSESNGLIKKECKIVSDNYAETLEQGESEN